MNELTVALISIVLGYLCSNFFSKYIEPKLIQKHLKIIETNPKWIVSKIKEQYYGFHDVDILLAEWKYGSFPYARINKKTHHIEIILSNDDTTTRDIDAIAQLALSVKLLIRYKLFFGDKPIYWLSIMCYMLDGGDININKVTFEEKEDKKPIDDLS